VYYKELNFKNSSQHCKCINSPKTVWFKTRMTSGVDEVPNKVTNIQTDVEDKFHHKLKGGLFLATVTGFAVIGGFGMTIAMAKKRDPHLFAQGLNGSKEFPESGGSLAMRALGRGTLYSVAGFSAFCFLVWKALGVHNLQEFREKMKSMMPAVPKKESEGRSDFKSVRELVTYIIEEDKRKSGS